MKNNEYFQAFHVRHPHTYWVEYFDGYSISNVLLTKTGGQGGEEEEEEEDTLIRLDTELFPHIHLPHHTNNWAAS